MEQIAVGVVSAIVAAPVIWLLARHIGFPIPYMEAGVRVADRAFVFESTQLRLSEFPGSVALIRPVLVSFRIMPLMPRWVFLLRQPLLFICFVLIFGTGVAFLITSGWGELTAPVVLVAAVIFMRLTYALFSSLPMNPYGIISILIAERGLLDLAQFRFTLCTPEELVLSEIVVVRPRLGFLPVPGAMIQLVLRLPRVSLPVFSCDVLLLDLPGDRTLNEIAADLSVAFRQAGSELLARPGTP
jgi:hypothetical protein